MTVEAIGKSSNVAKPRADRRKGGTLDVHDPTNNLKISIFSPTSTPIALAWVIFIESVRTPNSLISIQ